MSELSDKIKEAVHHLKEIGTGGQSFSSHSIDQAGIGGHNVIMGGDAKVKAEIINKNRTTSGMEQAIYSALSQQIYCAEADGGQGKLTVVNDPDIETYTSGLPAKPSSDQVRNAVKKCAPCP